jgi:hypothetical protein
MGMGKLQAAPRSGSKAFVTQSVGGSFAIIACRRPTLGASLAFRAANVKMPAPDLCGALRRGSCCVRSNRWEIAPAARGVTTGGSTEAPEMAWPTKVSDQPNPSDSTAATANVGVLVSAADLTFCSHDLFSFCKLIECSDQNMACKNQYPGSRLS